ncbi:hypothetical protein MBAV_001046 [Candidatus Magnetobacterium bavaricum]|uniref:Uncharacterized protein n=1 Tax=Candidatus Magnetobacterium bavaricum TaxID=29290 RepID=A0A0F3GY51_9BACT|nr:hypothetical protein MBAV_001046 [Candidatus Magnetobacterium bavaricum]
MILAATKDMYSPVTSDDITTPALPPSANAIVTNVTVMVSMLRCTNNISELNKLALTICRDDKPFGNIIAKHLVQSVPHYHERSNCLSRVAGLCYHVYRRPRRINNGQHGVQGTRVDVVIDEYARTADIVVKRLQCLKDGLWAHRRTANPQQQKIVRRFSYLSSHTLYFVCSLIGQV